jgi:hypothetical protein
VLVLNASGSGAANYSSVSIKPSGGPRTVSGNFPSGALIKFNGADNVTLDGSLNGITSRDLTITNSNITAPTVISLETGFVSSSVTRNTVTKSVTTNSSGYGARGITVGTGTTTSAPIITNNII